MSRPMFNQDLIDLHKAIDVLADTDDDTWLGVTNGRAQDYGPAYAASLVESANRLTEIMTWHLAAPLVDHDGGDEDDRLFQERGFLRAIRRPRSRWFKDRDRLVVVQEPELKPLPIMFRDPGDEQP